MNEKRVTRCSGVLASRLISFRFGVVSPLEAVTVTKLFVIFIVVRLFLMMIADKRREERVGDVVALHAYF